MARTPKKKDQKPEEIETDAWERFDRAVDSAIKSGPKPLKKPNQLGEGDK